MTQRPSVTERELVTWVRRDFGIDLIGAKPVGGGTDEAARTWRATTREGARVAVRVSSARAVGVWLASALALDGIPGVPMPWRTLDGRMWSQSGHQRLSVSTWVSDRPADPDRMTPEHWRALGRLLARVHAHPVTDALGPVPRAVTDPTDWVRRARDLPWTIVRHPRADGVTSALAGRLAGAVDALSAVADTAERLAGQVPEREPVLCHGDPHLGNVLLGADMVWLVDWDDAVLGARERDLILVVGGVLSSWAVTPEQTTWFAEGYGPLDVDPDSLWLHACLRALEDVVGFADRVLDTEHFDREERTAAVEILAGVLSERGIGRLVPEQWAWPAGAAR